MVLVENFSLSETGSGNDLNCFAVLFYFLYFLNLRILCWYPFDTGRKTNVDNTFRRRAIYVLCPGVMPESALLMFYSRLEKTQGTADANSFLKKIQAMLI